MSEREMHEKALDAAVEVAARVAGFTDKGIAKRPHKWWAEGRKTIAPIIRAYLASLSQATPAEGGAEPVAWLTMEPNGKVYANTTEWKARSIAESGDTVFPVYAAAPRVEPPTVGERTVEYYRESLAMNRGAYVEPRIAETLAALEYVRALASKEPTPTADGRERDSTGTAGGGR